MAKHHDTAKPLHERGFEALAAYKRGETLGVSQAAAVAAVVLGPRDALRPRGVELSNIARERGLEALAAYKRGETLGVSEGAATAAVIFGSRLAV